ncbi:hypothetical protein BDV38DRAFT_271951 [Aspergillus pseudotamarii]|uniref:FAD-binding PCMH-type domain-containing protein n=1 Tax=Aspergillus pseudotamarii TaxID=132259 RepID=A0A5N6SPI7_ASPPS|nr:uncharacterized protein BDV38DRAFT_271951 [Aspergillus pseudotamarii]KAE8136608.1 hypothetical protein BDV38DRAFT_271951 [Aspergillus pseudotamarii]
MVDDSILELSRLFPTLPVYIKSNPEFEHYRVSYNRALTDHFLTIPNASPLAIRSGGHDFFGRSVVTDGIVINMLAMDSITISPGRTSARVDGGVIAGALQQFLSAHQLFTPTAQLKTVGYMSWAFGGGYRFYIGTYGFGVDQILGARVVVASGEIIDTDDDQELLWALRRAGAGNFGVIVELRVKVCPAPKLYAGYLAFPLSEAATVFEGLGPVLANTVEETTAAAYGVGDLSSATFFCRTNIRGLNPEVGAIFSHHPPVHPLSAVIIYNNHGKGIRTKTPNGFSACFPNRFPRAILGELEERGLALDGGFPSVFPPKQIDVKQFFGMQATENLRRLKSRLSCWEVARRYFRAIGHDSGSLWSFL